MRPLPRRHAELNLIGAIYVLLAVPLSTAAVLFLAGVFAVLLIWGEPIDPRRMEFWSALAFFAGPLVILAIAWRAWFRVRRGDGSFLPSVLTRLLPALSALGVLLAVALGIKAYAVRWEQLASEADSFCFHWARHQRGLNFSCEETAVACLRMRPVDEAQGASSRRTALASCMESELMRRAEPSP